VDYLFGERAEAVLKMTRLDRQYAGPTARFRVPELADGVNDWSPMPTFYAPAQGCAKYILVNISEQFVGAYEYGRLVFSHPIASGKSGKPTPVGNFQVWAKDPNHKSSLYTKHDIPGGIPCPMPWALQFRKGDCWLHAGNLSGIKASHGCVRQRLADAKRLYDWGEVGTPVKVVKHF
jgi:lipoprotein-anchoring transpeptidase ErfK/SrfK